MARSIVSLIMSLNPFAHRRESAQSVPHKAIQTYQLSDSRVKVKVIGRTSPGMWRVIVGPGIGLLDGGKEQDWLEEDVPITARLPNYEFWITGYKNGVPQIEQ